MFLPPVIHASHPPIVRSEPTIQPKTFAFSAPRFSSLHWNIFQAWWLEQRFRRAFPALAPRENFGLARLTACFVSRYLHHLLQTHLLSAQLLPELLALARQTLFPRNSLPPPAAPPPSPEQVEEIKQACAGSILSLLPAFLCRRLLGDNQVDWAREVELELDIWADTWMNKHLAYKLLDLVIVRVLPEIAEKGVTELMEARLGHLP